MNVKTIYLVSCVSRKRDQRSPARDLYTSTWFRKAREYVERVGNAWYILSAEYGLVRPDDPIEPYEKSLNAMPVAERRAWAESVLKELDRIAPRVERVVLLAGRRYREFLCGPLTARGMQVCVPMSGMRIGEQQAWLGRSSTAE